MGLTVLYLLFSLAIGIYGRSLRDVESLPYLIEVNYEGPKNERVEQCIRNATETISARTVNCFLTGNETSHANPIVINVQTSDRCGYTGTNNTIFISDACIHEDTCLKLVGRAISGAKQTTQNVIPDLSNKKCGGKCPACENGGKLLDQTSGDCKCECIDDNIFSGDQCQNVNEDVNQEGCGPFINSENNGKIESKSNSSICYWLLTSDDPWDVFEITFNNLDLGKKKVKICGDSLIVHGLKNLESIQIPCNTEAELNQYLGKTFISDGNKLLIEYAPGRTVRQARTGPSISYKKLPKLSDDVDTSYIPSSDGSSVNGSVAAFISGGTILLCIVASLAIFLFCCKEDF